MPLAIVSRTPFFMGRAPRMEGRSQMGFGLDLIGNVAGFLIDGISWALTNLGNLLDVPLKILSQGIDLVFNGVADLLRNIPIVGDLLAQVMVLGGAILKFGLSIPGMVLREAGNVLGGIAKALKTEGTDGENQEKVDKAKDDIVSKAPDGVKENVKAILGASGVTGRNLTPSVSSSGTVTGAAGPTGAAGAPGMPGVEEPGIGTALAIGLPVIGGLILLAVLT
jgi:hypothetical protein